MSSSPPELPTNKRGLFSFGPTYRRTLIPVAILALASGLWFIGWRPSDVIAKTSELGSAGPAAFVVAGALMMSMLVPKTVVSLSSGALFGLLIGSMTLSITAVIAAGINFSIGRWWLGGWVAAREGPRWQVARGLAGDAGFTTHFLLRLSPVPTSVISYSMGAARARVRPFLAAAAVGSIPQWMWVWCGAATANAMQADATEPTMANGWIGVVVSATAAIGLAGILPRLAAIQMRKLDQPPNTNAAAPLP